MSTKQKRVALFGSFWNDAAMRTPNNQRRCTQKPFWSHGCLISWVRRYCCLRAGSVSTWNCIFWNIYAVLWAISQSAIGCYLKLWVNCSKLRLMLQFKTSTSENYFRKTRPSRVLYWSNFHSNDSHSSKALIIMELQGDSFARKVSEQKDAFLCRFLI